VTAIHRIGIIQRSSNGFLDKDVFSSAQASLGRLAVQALRQGQHASIRQRILEP